MDDANITTVVLVLRDQVRVDSPPVGENLKYQKRPCVSIHLIPSTMGIPPLVVEQQKIIRSLVFA